MSTAFSPGALPPWPPTPEHVRTQPGSCEPGAPLQPEKADNHHIKHKQQGQATNTQGIMHHVMAWLA
jgi:hypothetical protein